MNEQLLQFIWQNTLFDRNTIYTTKGEKIEIERVGDINHNAGPDFFNAKIKIGNTLWAGNVEVHCNASGWYEHGHYLDQAYNNVVLHVVFNDDKDCFTQSGYAIPCFVIPKNMGLIEKTQSLFEKKKWVFCEPWINSVEYISLKMWIEALLVERLKSRSDLINTLFDENKKSWEDTFYQLLLRGFGFGVNADAFQEIAEKTPLTVLAKHRNSILQLESLLMGQAKLLNDSESADDYAKLLQKEYLFLATKYSLRPIENNTVHFMRLRPPNFPTIRLSQFACMVHQSHALFSRILEKPSIDQLRDLFRVQSSVYWKSHFVFGKKIESTCKKMGETSVGMLIINVVAPMLFFYGKYTGNYDYSDYAMYLLDNIPSEKNTMIHNWTDLGVVCKSASDSQALHQLYTSYCKHKRCLFCAIGKTIIAKRVL